MKTRIQDIFRDTRAAQIVRLFALSMTLVLVASACERDTETVEGPSLNDLYGDFTVLEEFDVSQGTVDFSSGESVHFTARFSTLTDWTITITSQTSGSVKVIEGKSKIIDETTALWDGTTTAFPVFATGPCKAELFVTGDSSTQTATVTVAGTLVRTGKLITDFESGINPDWNLFRQSGGNMTFTIEDNEVVPEGEKYFDMGGEVDWDYLIGLLDFPATAIGANGFDLSTNPSDEYFNVVLYRPDTLNNGIMLFQFKEDDNGDGSFSEATEDMYSLELTGLDPGWQVVSIKYSDIPSLVNGAPAPAKGNGQHNPERLHTLSCLFLADPASGYSQMLMDYLVFTSGGPVKL